MCPGRRFGGGVSADRKWPSGLRIKTALRAVGAARSSNDYTRAGQGVN
jgi:hypothetical protein